MAIPKGLKDTKNYQMVSGLNEKLEAQPLSFLGDRVKISSDIYSVEGLTRVLVSHMEQISVTLKKIEYHLAIATDTNLNDQDVL